MVRMERWTAVTLITGNDGVPTGIRFIIIKPDRDPGKARTSIYNITVPEFASIPELVALDPPQLRGDLADD